MSDDRATITFCFDDGWRNAHTRAAPILERHGHRGTFYVITQMPDYMLAEGEGRMTAEQWQDLASRGHEIGCHSRTHRRFPSCSAELVADEIEGSKDDLARLGLAAETFAYPYGALPRSGDGPVQQAGFRAARLYNDRSNPRTADRWRLGAHGILASHTLADAARLIQDGIDHRSWLIFAFHQIESPAPQYGCTPELLDAICAHVSERGIPVVTVRDGLRWLDSTATSA
ncbi:MAG TPA: polysaccharide deacetylase family protein [Kofleriaceae bacterium]